MAKTRKLDTIRSEIAELQQALVPLREDRRTHDEAVARIDAWVDQQRDEINAIPFVSSAARGDRMLQTAGMRDDRSVACWLAWLDPDALKARLRRELDAVAADLCSDLPAAKRRELREAKEAELHALEIEEEACIAELERAGETIARRPDADPSIVLEVEAADEVQDEVEAQVEAHP